LLALLPTAAGFDRSGASAFAQEQTTLVGLTSLRTKFPMAPNLNRKRAVLVLTKIDEIMAW
jgi:hypothetical protein